MNLPSLTWQSVGRPGGTADRDDEIRVLCKWRDVIQLSTANAGGMESRTTTRTDMDESLSVCESRGMVPHRY